MIYTEVPSQKTCTTVPIKQGLFMINSTSSYSMPTAPRLQGAQRNGGSITIYEEHLPKLLNALNPEAFDSLILQNGRRGQFSQPTREQMIPKALQELNNLAKRVLKMRNVPQEEAYRGSSQLYFKHAHIRSLGEEIRNPLNPQEKRGVNTTAIYRSRRHPENPLTFVTTTPVGGLKNIGESAYRDDVAIDTALVNNVQPNVIPSSYSSVGDKLLDYSWLSELTPE
jgi:hypothetical protein